MYLHTGGLADGATAGIVIGAVIFVILHLILIGVIVYYIRLRSKNQKSTNIVCENNNTSDGDRQAEYHQLERSHSYAQPLDAVAPKDSTHSDNQSNTVSQENDRRRFLKRGVRRIFTRGCTIFFFKTVVDKTITILWQVAIYFFDFRNRVYTLQHGNWFCCYSIYVFYFSFSSSTLTSIRILSLMERLKQTCPMRHVRSIWVLLIVWISTIISVILDWLKLYSLYTGSIFSQSKWCGCLQQQICLCWTLCTC